ncbi:MAG: hypothetical protein V8T35_13400 [Prevotella sp.]
MRYNLSLDFLHEIDNRYSQQVTHGSELYKIHPTLTSFNLAHIGLRKPEHPSQLLLGETSLFSLAS